MRGCRPGLPRPRAAPGATRPERPCGRSRACASCRDLSVGEPVHVVAAEAQAPAQAREDAGLLLTAAACPPCDPALCALRPGYLPPFEPARRLPLAPGRISGRARWPSALRPRIYWVKLEAVRDPRPAFRCLLGSSLISSYLTFLNTWQCRKARSRRSFL